MTLDVCRWRGGYGSWWRVERTTPGARQLWRGVHVELAFEPREGVSASETSAAKDFVLERLTIMPGPGK